MENLRELLVHEIQDLYSAEQQLIEALPKMAEKAESPELKAAFQQHLEETQEHARRLEQAAELLGEKPTGVPCVGMKGLIKEGEEVMKEAKKSQVLDAGLIGAAQKVEHYEIAAYGTASAHAEELELMEVVELLEATLDEEQLCNEKLTQIAESGVNRDAAAAVERRRGRSSRAADRAAKRKR
jgi:ferritin-like metal-binding protein YciE